MAIFHKQVALGISPTDSNTLQQIAIPPEKIRLQLVGGTRTNVWSSCAATTKRYIGGLDCYIWTELGRGSLPAPATRFTITRDKFQYFSAAHAILWGDADSNGWESAVSEFFWDEGEESIFIACTAAEGGNQPPLSSLSMSDVFEKWCSRSQAIPFQWSIVVILSF